MFEWHCGGALSLFLSDKSGKAIVGIITNPCVLDSIDPKRRFPPGLRTCKRLFFQKPPQKKRRETPKQATKLNYLYKREKECTTAIGLYYKPNRNHTAIRLSVP